MRRLIGLAVTLAFVSIAAIAGAATSEKVLNEPGVDEVDPSASDGYLVWTADTEARPFRYHSYVMADGGDPVRINPVGTQSPAVSIDGATIVYQEDTSNPFDEDLWFFDPVTETRTAPPEGVNTPKSEYEPSLSGDWLLFTRDNGNRVPLSEAWVKVVLFDLSAGTHTVLKTMPRPYLSHYLISGQVNGNWATFESCRARRGEFLDCQVFLYDISAGGDPVQVANPGVQQYAGSVSSDGTVYLVRTRNRDHYVCGSHTTLVRVPMGGQGVVIASLPDGKDSYSTFALDEPGGSTTLYFDRFPCRTNVGGIYRIQDADTTS